MPFALRHKQSGELFACKLINIYDFAYHGVKVWEDEASATNGYASFLVEQGIDDSWQWEISTLSDSQLKMGNVKLNNDPAKKVYLTPEGKIANAPVQ